MPIPQSAKQAAINVARQVARESNEVLKSAREQISPIPEIPQKKEEPKPQQNEQKPKDMSFLQSYRNELEDIKRENLFKELQRKISEGEEIPLENYVKELSSEQREVLRAQSEAVKMQKEAQKTQTRQSIPAIISKRAKGMMGTIKKRNEQHVEMRQPPSG